MYVEVPIRALPAKRILRILCRETCLSFCFYLKANPIKTSDQEELLSFWLSGFLVLLSWSLKHYLCWFWGQDVKLYLTYDWIIQADQSLTALLAADNKFIFALKRLSSNWNQCFFLIWCFWKLKHIWALSCYEILVFCLPFLRFILEDENSNLLPHVVLSSICWTQSGPPGHPRSFYPTAVLDWRTMGNSSFLLPLGAESLPRFILKYSQNIYTPSTCWKRIFDIINDTYIMTSKWEKLKPKSLIGLKNI